MRSARLSVVLAAITLFVAACQATTGGAPDAFCDPILETEVAMAQGPDVDFDTATEEEVGTALAAFAERVNPLIDQVEANAPDELQDEISTLASTTRSALETGDEAALESEEFQAADVAVARYVVDNCDIESHQVEGFDYGYNNVPGTVAEGRVAFIFDNTGEELHEMVVFRINDESMTIDQLLEMPEEEGMALVTFSGAAFAEAGQEDIMFADLEAGRYGIVCFIPVGTASFADLPEDESDVTQPPHFTQGMVAEFTVEG